MHVLILTLAGAGWPPLPERTSRPGCGLGEPSTTLLVSEWAVLSTVESPPGHATSGTDREGRPHQPARQSIVQVDTAVRDIQVVSESGLVPSPTEVSEVRRDRGNAVRSTGKMSPRRPRMCC